MSLIGHEQVWLVMFEDLIVFDEFGNRTQWNSLTQMFGFVVGLVLFSFFGCLRIEKKMHAKKHLGQKQELEGPTI